MSGDSLRSHTDLHNKLSNGTIRVPLENPAVSNGSGNWQAGQVASPFR